MSLANLASADVALGDIGPSFVDDLILINLDGVVQIVDFTSGNGAILWGVAIGSLSAAEIEEYLELAPTHRRARTLDLDARGADIRILGALCPDPAAPTLPVIERLQKLRTAITIHEDDASPAALHLWAYNASGAALGANAAIRLSALGFCKWI